MRILPYLLGAIFVPLMLLVAPFDRQMMMDYDYQYVDQLADLYIVCSALMAYGLARSQSDRTAPSVLTGRMLELGLVYAAACYEGHLSHHLNLFGLGFYAVINMVVISLMVRSGYVNRSTRLPLGLALVLIAVGMGAGALALRGIGSGLACLALYLLLGACAHLPGRLDASGDPTS